MNTKAATPQTAPKLVAPPKMTGYQKYVLMMLTLVATLNLVDRQLMSILLESINQEFSLSDTQLGFLTGFAFAIFYALMGIPLAKLADHGNRRKLISGAIAVWSVMSAACGLTTGFVTLLLTRIGVGVGEAGSAPAVQTLLSDYFPKERLSSAIAIQSIGIYAGIVIAFLFGGWINEWFSWRMAFIVIGLPGVLFAIWFGLTVREPKRGEINNIPDTEPTPPVYKTFRHLWNLRSYRWIVCAISFQSFVAYGSMVWAPSFFIRSHGLSSGEVGTWLALSVGVAGGLGCYFGGIFSDYVANKTGDPRWHLRISAISTLLTIPLIFGIYLSSSPYVALCLSAGAWFLSNVWLGPAQAIVQWLAQLRMRGMALAVVLFAGNLIGQGFGPQLVGLISDALAGAYAQDSLRYALLISLVLATIAAVGFFFLATRTLISDLRSNAPSE